MKIKKSAFQVVTIGALLVLLFCGCRSAGVVKNAEIDLGDSEKFSQEELQAAADCAMKDFQKDFRDCELKKISYDEEMSSYMAVLSSDDPNAAEITEGNAIMLWGDFVTGDNPKPGLGANQTYPGYHWLLIRDDADSPWRVDPYGGGWV